MTGKVWVSDYDNLDDLDDVLDDETDEADHPGAQASWRMIERFKEKRALKKQLDYWDELDKM